MKPTAMILEGNGFDSPVRLIVHVREGAQFPHRREWINDDSGRMHSLDYREDGQLTSLDLEFSADQDLSFIPEPERTLVEFFHKEAAKEYFQEEHSVETSLSNSSF